MEQQDNETAPFVPVIARLDRLDLLLEVLEEKHSSSKAGSPAADCRTLSSALQEVKHKGTLLDRLALLEKRVLQLSLEIGEGNTSKSSSSTVQVSETIGDKDYSSSPKMKDDNIRAVIVTAQDPPVQLQGKAASSADGLKGGGQKKKAQKKWIWFLRLRC